MEYHGIENLKPTELTSEYPQKLRYTICLHEKEKSRVTFIRKQKSGISE